MVRVKTMVYKVRLAKSEEGYAVWCPALPGCATQGDTEEEALENIKIAIREYLETIDDSMEDGVEVREVEVAA